MHYFIIMGGFMYNPLRTKAWQKLEKLAQQSQSDLIVDYFAKYPGRFDKMSQKVEGLFVDYSKNKISPSVLSELLKLAQESPLQSKIEQMYSGDQINASEARPVLHTALRNRSNSAVMVDGQNIMPQINAALQRIEIFSDAVRNGKWLGFSGQRIKNIVNIGIGGSHLGPNMVCRALLDYQHHQLRCFFVSNVDSSHIQKTLKYLKQEETLFIVSSKSFVTQETHINACTSKKWFLEHAQTTEENITQHFVAVSANIEAAVAFGIDRKNIFEFWDWVGGRFSLWSSIGLPIAMSIGYSRFVELLEGAHELDKHFFEAPFENNLPVLLGLIGIWNINFQAADSQAVIPYDQQLTQFPVFLQQLDMESNGKSIDVNGAAISYATAPIIWGQTGSNGQHAFFQLLHQGTRFVPIDFIASLSQSSDTPEHNMALLTNMLAQAEAFMLGTGDVDPSYHYCEGNKPSNVILMDKITPKNIGALIALYEHKVFVQGVIWNINSFDQWGVQLGKTLANNLTKSSDAKHDESTQGLLNMVRAGLED
jgi:glucose-6-phosphate isomerase